jgi:hypothetical protein
MRELSAPPITSVLGMFEKWLLDDISTTVCLEAIMQILNLPDQ